MTRIVYFCNPNRQRQDMMKRTTILLATLCCATLMMVGCGKDYDEKIIGSWKLDYWIVYSESGTNGDAVENWIFTFQKGGKGVLTSPHINPIDYSTELTATEFDYSIDDEELKMSLPDFESNHIEKLDDKKMILSQLSTTSNGTQLIEFSFTKK